MSLPRLDPLASLMLRSLRTGLSRPLVLMYHGTPAPPETPGRYSLRADRFAAHMAVIARIGAPTRLIRELFVARDPTPGIYITFDDGYLDNLEHALPALQAHGLRATWYVPSARIGRSVDWCPMSPKQARLMSTPHLRQLLAAGMEVGSHTRTHADLQRLPADLLHSEIVDSRRELQDTLGCDVTSFAYPYGRMNEEVVAMVEKAGYSNACSTRAGFVNAADGPYRIRRITVFDSDSPGDLVRKMVLGANQGSSRDLLRYWLGRRLARLPALLRRDQN